mgnify:CR=1 FL=1
MRYDAERRTHDFDSGHIILQYGLYHFRKAVLMQERKWSYILTYLLRPFVKSDGAMEYLYTGTDLRQREDMETKLMAGIRAGIVLCMVKQRDEEHEEESGSNGSGSNGGSNGNGIGKIKHHNGRIGRNKKETKVRKRIRKKWKDKKNKTHAKVVIQQVLHALYMLWMESGMKPTLIFETMDADGDGALTMKEFRTGLHKLGLNIDPKDAKIVFQQLDKDHSGDLVYAELSRAIRKAGKHPPPATFTVEQSIHNDPFHSQVEAGSLTALDHIHRSHLIGIGGTNSESVTATAGNKNGSSLHSNCWVCSGYKEEVFVYQVPRGSTDEALEDCAVCFDFEDFLPREMARQDERTATSGGVQFVTRRVVPPGEIRYYFLVGGTAKHNPDEPSAPLDIKYMIKKKRAVTNQGNSWSKIASKYTTRPRCNVRKIEFRTGYLITRSLPRPTGLIWDDLQDIEDQEQESDNALPESLENNMDSNGSNGNGNKEQEEEKEPMTAAQKRELQKNKIRVITADKTSDIIAHIWERKSRSDKVHRETKKAPLDLHTYTDQFFRTEFGVELGTRRMKAFEVGIKANWEGNTRIRWFGTMIGWVPLRINKDFDTPPFIEATISYTTVLMACLPLETIEEKMSQQSCMIDFDVLLTTLDAGNIVDATTSENRENPNGEQLNGWGDEGRNNTPSVFDAHFLATSAYQLLVRKLKLQVEKTFHAKEIEIDTALNIIMEYWYRWRMAPETMEVEEDIIEIENTVSRVSIAVQNMLSSTRSFFDHRNTVAWNKEQMLDAQNASFDADWLRCSCGPLQPFLKNLNEQEIKTIRTIFNKHYGKMENIFSLYAAADGGPYELGKYGAMQLFRDLRMLSDPRLEAEEAAEKKKEQLIAAAEKKKQKLAGASGFGVGGNLLSALNSLEREMTGDKDNVEHDPRTVHAPAGKWRRKKDRGCIVYQVCE